MTTIAPPSSASPAPRPHEAQDEAPPTPRWRVWGANLAQLLIAVVALVAMRFALARHAALVGRSAPSIVLADLESAASVPARRDVLAGLDGRVVVLDFWAPWCGPCRRQMSTLASFAREHDAARVAVVGVMEEGDAEDARRIVREAAATYAEFADDGAVARAYGVSAFPTIVVLSRDRRVVAVHTGLTLASELEASVAAAL